MLRTATTALRYSGCSGPPTGSVSTTGETPTTSMPGVAPSSRTAAASVAARSPRLAPSASTPSRGGGRSSARVRRRVTATSAKRLRDRRRGLVHRDLGRLHPGVGHADPGEALRERLDQVDRFAADDVGERLGELAVVDGAREVVGGGRGADVELESDVDDEVLAVAALLREHAVPAAGGEAAQDDAVAHAALLRLPGAGRGDGGDGADGVRGRPRLVDPHAPGAGRGREHGGGGRDEVALARSRPLVGHGHGLAEEPLARRADEQRVAERDAARRGGRGGPSCAGRAWRSRSPGSSTMRSASTPASTSASTRRSSSARTSATTSP